MRISLLVVAIAIFGCGIQNAHANGFNEILELQQQWDESKGLQGAPAVTTARQQLSAKLQSTPLEAAHIGGLSADEIIDCAIEHSQTASPSGEDSLTYCIDTAYQRYKHR